MNGVSKELGNQTPKALLSAVQIAQTARDTAMRKQPSHQRRKPLFVAASLSTHPPAIPKGNRSTSAFWPEEMEEKQNYTEAASVLAGSGADFLFMEMMKDMVHAPRALA